MATAPKKGQAEQDACAARDMAELALLEFLVHHVTAADRRAVRECSGEALGTLTDDLPEHDLVAQ